jgi:hypothetical protein
MVCDFLGVEPDSSAVLGALYDSQRPDGKLHPSPEFVKSHQTTSMLSGKATAQHEAARAMTGNAVCLKKLRSAVLAHVV